MPRIIAGKWKGRRIDAPAGSTVRPTGDRVREAWMSIVHNDLPEARVVDLCAGSGALGLEALSRGASTCDFVDQSARALSSIQANLDKLGGHTGARLQKDDALRFVRRLDAGAYDVAFADPPYASTVAADLVNEWLSRRFAHIFAVEHDASLELPGGGDRRRYGSTAITFYR